MKITKAEHRAYDDDININLTVDVENNNEETVELAKYNALVVDENGNCVGGESYIQEYDAYAEKGETFSIDFGQYLSKFSVADLGKATAVVDLTTFKREFKKLGEIDCPQDYKSPTKSDKSIDFGDVRVYGVIALRDKPPENNSDDHNVGLKIGVKNMSDKHIQQVKVKCQLIDTKDSIVMDSEAQEALPGNASITLQPYLYAKSGKMKGATIKVNISTFHELTHYNAESSMKPGKD